MSELDDLIYECRSRASKEQSRQIVSISIYNTMDRMLTLANECERLASDVTRLYRDALTFDRRARRWERFGRIQWANLRDCCERSMKLARDVDSLRTRLAAAEARVSSAEVVISAAQAYLEHVDFCECDVCYHAAVHRARFGGGSNG
jgi:hypothetical protein